MQAARQERAAVHDLTRVLLWCGATAAVPFETGIQRVTRRLYSGLGRLGMPVVPVGWDARTRLLSPLALCGKTVEQAGDWLVVPEIPLAALADGVSPVQLARAYGLRVAAVVHDLVPLRRPQDYGAAELDLYRRYFGMFAEASLVLATTELVAGHLRMHLASEGLRAPPIAVVPLPAQFADSARMEAAALPRAPGEPLRLLMVSTWEPRKNGPALLRALQAAQRPIRLTVAGRRGCFPAYDAELLGLVASAPPGMVTVHGGWVNDDGLARLYRGHHASVYPSVEEGFGLPVVESLWLGRPCVCHAGSAMAEVAPGGGTLMCDMMDNEALVACLRRLADEPDLAARLGAEITARSLRSWADYAGDVAALLKDGGQARLGRG